MTQKKILKSLLATASAAALAFGAGNAMAVVHISNVAVSNTNTAIEWNTNVIPPSMSTLKHNLAGREIVIDTANRSYEIDFAGKGTTNTSLSTAANDIITGFVNTGGGNLTNIVRFVGGGNDATISAQYGAGTTMVSKGLLTFDFNDIAQTIHLAPGAGNTANYVGTVFTSTGGVAGTIDVEAGTVKLGTFDNAALVNHLTVQTGAVAVTSGAGNGDIALNQDITLHGTAILQVTAGDAIGVNDVIASGAGEGEVQFLATNGTTIITTHGANFGTAGAQLGSISTAVGTGEFVFDDTVTTIGAQTITLGTGSTIILEGACTVTGNLNGAGTFAVNGDNVTFTGTAGGVAGTKGTALTAMTLQTDHNLTLHGGGAAQDIWAPITNTVGGAAGTASKGNVIIEGMGAALGVNGVVTGLSLHNNVGAAGTGLLDVVTFEGATGIATLDADVSINATAIKFTNAASQVQLNDGCALNGVITSFGGASRGVIAVNSGASTAGGFADVAFGKVKFVSQANTDVTFTYDANGANAGKVTTLTSLDFSGANANSNATLIADMTHVPAVTAAPGLTITGFTAGGASTGNIKIINNNTTAKSFVLTAGGAVGTHTAGSGVTTDAFQSIDATGQVLTLAAGVFKVKDVMASKVLLNRVTFGTYDVLDANSPTEIHIVGAGASTIADDSIISTAAQPLNKFNFQTNQAVTIGNNVNIYLATGTILNNVPAAGVQAGNFGTLIFTGNSIVDPQVGTSAFTIAEIQINNGGTPNQVVTFNKAVYVTPGTGVSFNSAASTALFNSDVHSALVPAGANQGVAQFGASSTVANDIGVVGAGNALKQVQINTTDTVTAAGTTYNTQNTTFNQDGTLVLNSTVATANTQFGIVTVATANTGKIVINNDATLVAGAAGLVGVKDKGLKEFNLAADKTLTVTAGAGGGFFGNITTATANTGTVIIGGAMDSSGQMNVGTAALPVKTITAPAAGDVVLGNLYASTINAGAGRTITATTFGTTNTGSTVTTGGTAVVADGGSANIVTGTGTFNTAGNATLNGALGASAAARLTAFNIQGDNTKTVTFKDKAIFADAIGQGAATLALTQNTTVTGVAGAGAVYTLTGSTLNLGANTLTLDENVNVINGATLNFVYNGQNKVVTLAAARTATITTGTVTLTRAAGSTLPANGAKLAVFVDVNGAPVAIGGSTATNVVMTPGGFVKGSTYDILTHELTFITSVASRDILSANAAVASPQASAVAASIASDYVSGKATAFIGFLDAAPDATTRDAIVTKVADRSGAMGIQQATQDAMTGVSRLVAGRMSTSTATYSQSAVGVAAGDSAEKFGVWAEVLGGTATQKLRKGVSGFKSKMFGGVVGADTMLSDHATLGVMVGNSNNTVKFSDTKAGDKTKSNSWLFGAYGSYDFADNFFVQANALVASSNVKANEKRAIVGGTTVATGKYTLMGYGAEVLGGYRYKFDNSTITPTAGLRFNYFGDVSYTETGAGAQNLKVDTKASSTVSAVVGVKLGTMVDMDGTTLLPEVHTNLDYALTNAVSKSGYTIGDSSNINYKGSKAARTGFNFGAGLTAQSDNMEYGVGYDAYIADKYLGQQGSVKVKLKF